MSVDERTRLAIRSWFAEQLNDEPADAIMESMPPIEWTDVATKDDIALMGRELRAETAELRAEMHELRAEMHGEFAGVHNEFASVRNELADFRNDFVDMKRWTVMSGIGIATSSWAAAIAMVALN